MTADDAVRPVRELTMGKPTIRQFTDAEQVSHAAAEEFIRLAREAIAVRGRFTVALAGGSTPRRLYQLLADTPYLERVNWPRVEFFWGDERTVPPDHKDSNFHMANEALLHKLPIAAANLHRMQAERPDPDAAARDYQHEIARVFGVTAEGEPPAFDLILLGMGPDGHTASLFPSTAALQETGRWVVSNWVAKFNTHRVTLTYRVLNRAAHVLFLVAGADKAHVLAEVLEGPSDPERLPSQRVRPGAGQLTWFVDLDAAGRLTRPAT
jgi:6-phosphogluconolactonase